MKIQEKKNIDCIFVYGTLRQDGVFPISEFLENRVEYLGKATIPGKIYFVNYYPGLVLTNAGKHRVHGEIYKMTDPADVFSLDEYEGVSVIPSPGDLYKRVIVEATLLSDIIIECLVYEYNRPITSEMKWIPSGDFINP